MCEGAVYSRHYESRLPLPPAEEGKLQQTLIRLDEPLAGRVCTSGCLYLLNGIDQQPLVPVHGVVAAVLFPRLAELCNRPWRCVVCGVCSAWRGPDSETNVKGSVAGRPRRAGSKPTTTFYSRASPVDCSRWLGGNHARCKARMPVTNRLIVPKDSTTRVIT